MMIQLDRVVVEPSFPLSAVAYYAIPLSLSQRSCDSVGTLAPPSSRPQVPFVGVTTNDGLNELYLRAMKLTALFGCSTSAMMFFYAHDILRYWIGLAFELHSSSILMILAVANLLFALTTSPGLILEAKNRIKVSTVYTWIAAGTNIVFLALLVPTIGVEGAAWAVFANAATQVTVGFFTHVHTRVLSVSLRELVTRSFVRPCVSVVIMAPLMIWASGRVENLIELAFVCIATFICYFVVTALLGTYDDRDWTAARTLLRRRGA